MLTLGVANLRPSRQLRQGGTELAFDHEVARRMQHVERALDVGVDIGIGRMKAEGYRDQRGEVQDDRAAAHRLAHAVRIADVSGDVAGAAIEPAPRIEGPESLSSPAGANRNREFARTRVGVAIVIGALTTISRLALRAESVADWPSADPALRPRTSLGTAGRSFSEGRKAPKSAGSNPDGLTPSITAAEGRRASAMSPRRSRGRRAQRAAITHRRFYSADFDRIRPGFRELSGRG